MPLWIVQCNGIVEKQTNRHTDMSFLSLQKELTYVMSFLSLQKELTYVQTTWKKDLYQISHWDAMQNMDYSIWNK